MDPAVQLQHLTRRAALAALAALATLAAQFLAALAQPRLGEG